MSRYLVIAVKSAACTDRVHEAEDLSDGLERFETAAARMADDGARRVVLLDARDGAILADSRG